MIAVAARKQLVDVNTAPVLTLPDLATYLRIHPSTVYRLLKDGFPGFKVGRDWRFSRAAVDIWCAKQAEVSTTATGNYRRKPQ
jgi:excisionase family DNA binding protein